MKNNKYSLEPQVSAESKGAGSMAARNNYHQASSLSIEGASSGHPAKRFSSQKSFASASADSPLTEEEENSGPFRVCILDDDRSASKDLKQLLSSVGYEVLCLDKVIGSSNSIRSYNPDLLVVDVQMTSISGSTLLEVLRHNLKQFPVLILHSDLEEEDLMELAHKAGADDFITKDGNYVALLSRIKYYSRIMAGV